MKSFWRRNGILIILAALALAGVTAVASFFLGGLADPLSNALGVIGTPVRSAASGIADWVEGIYTYAFERDAMLDEIARLRRELAAMEAQAREGAADSLENERLRNLLDLREKRRDFALESASVTSRSLSNWESSLTLSKGSVHGVAAGQAVVDDAGILVGVISEVGYNWSTLITVIDTGIEMGGQIARTGDAAILEGDFALMREGKLKLSYLPEDAELIAGDMVLTSGMGGAYPAGLPVGPIESIHSDVSGMSRYAVVVPRTAPDDLKQVFIIKEFDLVE